MSYDNIYHVPMVQEGRMLWTREKHKSYCDVEKLDKGHAVELHQRRGLVEELYVFEEAAHAAMFFGWGYLDCPFEREQKPDLMTLRIGGVVVDTKGWNDGKLREKSKTALHYRKCLNGFTDCQDRCSEDAEGNCEYTCEEYERLRADQDWRVIKKHFDIEDAPPIPLEEL